jgi:sec-independent protein translocase protein TatC
MSGSGRSNLPVSDDTARTIQSGREGLGVVLRTAQKRLQVVFVAFVIGMLGTIMAMRGYIWPQLKKDLLAKGASVIAQTPFDVILLQVKIGLGVGVIFALPVLFYYAKQPLADRDLVPDVEVSRWKLVGVGGLSLALGLGGMVYAYFLFFPIMFTFLAGNAMAADLAPMYSIVDWTQFILVLALSFALAAQMPLAMMSLGYTEVMPYEVFRDKWRYAVVIIFGFGALFSPPDPFTQLMWAMPLLALYGFSLYLTKVVVTARRGSERLDFAGVLRARWNTLLGGAAVGAALGYAYASYDLHAYGNLALEAIGSSYRAVPVSVTGAGGVGAIVGLVVAALAVLYLAVEAAAAAAQAGVVGDLGDPDAIDLSGLDEMGVRAAPPEAFAAMDETTALQAASDAMEADDPEKAQAILDRFDAAQDVQAAAAEPPVDEADGGGATDAPAGEAETADPITSTTAGVFNAFTEDETTEDDIGGYYYDIAFILDSLRSRMFHVTAVFMGVLALTFGALYQGGLGYVKRDFLSRLPAEIRPEELQVITLHPVEALVFEVKVSTLFAAVAVLPFLLYYAWPALKDRGLIRGDRDTVYLWGVSILLALLAGSAIGYAFVAPEIISYLVADSARAGMVISYRVNNFLWMVFLLTVGIGLLAEIPITMWMAHYTGIVGYETMRRRWRVPVISAFVFGSLVTPDSLYTMLLIGIPIALAYLFGIAVLAVVSLGGRFGGPEPTSRAT